MKVIYPRVVGHVPLEMFETARDDVARLTDGDITQDCYFNLHGERALGEYPADRPDISPLIEIIQQHEHRRIRLVEFTIRTALTLPGATPVLQTGNGRVDDMHRDGNRFDPVHRYMTSSVLSTEFGKRHKTFEPGSVIRFDRLKHQAPVNKTEEPVLRTLVRVAVFFNRFI